VTKRTDIEGPFRRDIIGSAALHKFGAEATVTHGILFASKREARRWGDLLLLERGGVIRDLRRQVKIALLGRDGPILTPTGRQAHYVADFCYTEVKSGAYVVEDSKGFQTPEYKLKRAILAAQGVVIRET
jgi:Protein of unknown function (DUF1064)